MDANVSTELDALQFEEEEEGTSYLADLNKVPDFVDEPPVELSEVSPEGSWHTVRSADYYYKTPAQHEAIKTTG